jgi:hypothetical protein
MLLRMKLMLFVLRNTIRPTSTREPKLGFALKTMLANVRRNCANRRYTKAKPLCLKEKCPLELGFATAKEVILAQKFQIANCSQY